MSIVHHPNPETILAHAAGTLDPTLALVVTRHLAMCDACREQSRWGEALGGVLLERGGQKSVTAGGAERSLAMVRARIAEADIESGAARGADGSDSARIWQLLKDPGGDLPWQSLAPGIEHHLVSRAAGHRGWARLFRFQPGVSLPRHSHGGDEYALVLQGSYVDESGRYAAGDFSEADAAFSHEPVVDSQIPCIALIAATGGIRFEHPMYRAASRLLGI